MMTIAILDGKEVNAEIINAEQHRYTGMWHPPVNPIANPTCDILCNCGEMLKYVGEEVVHYKRGCFDVPEYESRPSRVWEIKQADIENELINTQKRLIIACNAISEMVRCVAEVSQSFVQEELLAISKAWSEYESKYPLKGDTENGLG